MAGSSKGVVLAAIAGNFVITLAKGGAYLMSGSGAMLSEAIHSFADTANQWLLYLGVTKSEKPADKDHPYGYGVDRYAFALISAVGIFFLGCGATVGHAVHHLIHPPEKFDYDMITFGVLAFSLAIEAIVLYKALASVRQEMGNQSFFKFLKTSSDPTIIAVLLEDSVACLGVLVAFSGIGLSYLTGNPIYDTLGSLVIGLMLGGIAIWLGLRNRKLILGQSIPEDVLKGALQYLNDQPSIHKVLDPKSRIIGAGKFRFKAEIEFDPAHFSANLKPLLIDKFPEASAEEIDIISRDIAFRVLEDLGSEIDRIESDLIQKYPRLKHVDFEAD